MQSRSDMWKEYAAKGNVPFETVAIIDGTEYPASSAPVIERGAFSDEPAIGGCVTASLQISILTDDDISKSAETVIKARYVNGDEATEWLEEGTFYVSKRSKDYSSGLLTLTCYDKMLMTNKDYFDSEDEGVWPQAMSDVVDAIAEWLGIEIDERTVINTGDAYYVPCPTDLTVMQVLGHIAAAHGGNWIITPQGKLRLVPLAEAPEDSSDDEIEVVAVLGALTQASDMTISGITVEGTDGTSYTAGDDSAYTLTVTELPCASQDICDDLYASLGGLTYHPYTMTNAIYDPAAEIGDVITYADQVRSILYNESATFDIAHRATASAPSVAEAEDEYPYLSSTAKLAKSIAQVSASVATTATSIASSIVERTAESILATVSSTYAPLAGTVTGIKAYYAISDSADEYPEQVLEDGLSALVGYARVGIALVGDSGWIDEMPVYDDGDYVWMCHLITYADGSTAWTEPTLITDGSIASDILTLSETTAAIKILADSILQTITATSAAWYTKGYTISATSYGTPDDAGYSASAYKGAYYLDQETGYLYLSDGSAWEYVDTLSSTAETLESSISQTASEILATVAKTSSTWDDSGYKDALTSYGTPDEAGYDAADYGGLYYIDQNTGYVYQSDGETWGQLEELDTVKTSIETLIAESITDSAASITSAITASYEKYVEDALGDYSTTETMENYISQTVSDSTNSIMLDVSTTYATKATAIFTGTSSTTSGAPYKTVVCDDFTESDLVSGVIIRVTFSSANAAYPLGLNVNGTGNIEVYANGSVWTSGSSHNWSAGATVVFRYDGTRWNLVETGSYEYVESVVEASLVLSIKEEDGVKYGVLSGNADYIKFTAGQFIVEANNFSIDENGDGTIGDWVIGETALYNGTESIDSWNAGAYVGTDGIRYVAADEDLNMSFVQLDEDGITLWDNYATGGYHYISHMDNSTISVGRHKGTGSSWEDANDFYGGGFLIGRDTYPKFIAYDSGASEKLVIMPGATISGYPNGYIETDLATTVNSDLIVNGPFSVTYSEEIEKVTYTQTLQVASTGVYIGNGKHTNCIPTVKYGSISSSVSGGAYMYKDITFGTEYSEIPEVFVSLTGVSASGDGDYGNISASVVSTTTTGCRIYVSNSGSTTRTPGINWLAVGLLY